MPLIERVDGFQRVEVNAVRVQQLYPDAYTAQAQAQAAKGFEEVDVTFGPRPEAGGDR